MNPLEILTANKLRVQEYTLGAQDDFWHSCIFNSSDEPISGGFGKSKDQSRKIAFAEYLERTTYQIICKSGENIRKKWGLDIIPTGCGFAAGFDLANTELRSVGEALERWTMSKWIDDGYKIDRVNKDTIEKSLSPASKWIYDQFDEVLFFRKTMVISYKNKFLKYDIGFSVALSADGAFPGSSAQYQQGDLWEHALIESFRHLLIYKNTAESNSFPDNRVRFFAKNSKVALEAINNADKLKWPIPQIKFQYSEEFNSGEFYLARTVVDGWRSWHEGPLERFVY